MTPIAEKVLRAVEHRPYPLTQGPWALAMSWHDLLFMHWPVPEEALRPLVPPGLAVDTFDGSAWLGVVPFRMTGVRPRLLPSVPALSDFPEINLRTYVTRGGRPGVWFFSLDAHNPVAVRIARASYGLPYFDARMSSETGSGGTVRYRSERTHRGVPPARFAASYAPTGELPSSRPGSLEHFLTERYCLYSADRRGRVRRGEIHHQLWPLHGAEVEVEELDMTAQIGLKLPREEPVLHFSERLDVFAWLPKRVVEP